MTSWFQGAVGPPPVGESRVQMLQLREEKRWVFISQETESTSSEPPVKPGTPASPSSCRTGQQGAHFPSDGGEYVRKVTNDICLPFSATRWWQRAQLCVRRSFFSIVFGFMSPEVTRSFKYTCCYNFFIFLNFHTFIYCPFVRHRCSRNLTCDWDLAVSSALLRVILTTFTCKTIYWIHSMLNDSSYGLNHVAERLKSKPDKAGQQVVGSSVVSPDRTCGSTDTVDCGEDLQPQAE